MGGRGERGLLMTVNIGDLPRRRAHLAPSTEALVEATGRRATIASSRPCQLRRHWLARGLVLVEIVSPSYS